MLLSQLKPTKEYVASHRYTGTELYRFIVNKVTKDIKGKIVSIVVQHLDAFRKVETFEVDDWYFENIREPVTATEFFIMYTNWHNHWKEGVHQDLAFAKGVSISIHHSLRLRSTVKEGVGRFEPFDDRLMQFFLDNSRYEIT